MDKLKQDKQIVELAKFTAQTSPGWNDVVICQCGWQGQPKELEGKILPGTLLDSLIELSCPSCSTVLAHISNRLGYLPGPLKKVN